MTARVRLLLLIGLAVPAPALSQRALTQFGLESWQRKQGMPGLTIEGIAQTRDGYLWVATEDGLVRFDGVHFTNWTTRTTPALATNDLTELEVDRAGALWIGSVGGGLARYQAGAIRQYRMADGLLSDVIHTLHEQTDGTLWVGTAAGLNRMRNGVVDAPVPALAQRIIRTLASSRAGGVWIGTERQGVFELRAGVLHSPRGAEAMRHESVRALQEDSAGLWIGTGRGLFLLRRDRLEDVSARHGFAGQEVRSLTRDRDGSLWIATAARGLARLHGGRIEFITQKQGLPGDAVGELLLDAEGNLWVGTLGYGLAVMRPALFSAVSPRDGLSGPVALGTLQGRDSAMWVGTYGGGLNRIAGGRITSFRADVVGSDFILSLAETPDGTLWIGTRNGLRLRKNGRFSEYRPNGQPIRGGVLALFHSARSGLWIGTSAGLGRLHAGRFTFHTTATGLPSDFVDVIYEGRDGTIWIGTNGGVVQWRDGFLRKYSRADGLASDLVLAITEDTSGAFWFGTNTGLSRLKDGVFRTIDTRHGLPDEKVYWIHQDQRGQFWMTGNDGVLRVTRAAMDSVADGLATTARFDLFSESDGLPSPEINGGIQPAAWQDHAGRIWVPTMNGLGVFHPDSVGHVTDDFPVLVPRITADDREIAMTDTVQVHAGTRRLEIQYTGLSHRNPHAMRFQYRLDGYDDDWVEARQERRAIYTGVPPGRYTFRVRARNSRGNWSASEAALPLTVAPLFHQRGAVRVTAVVLALLALVVADRIRVRSHRRRERELLALAEQRRRAEARYRDLFEHANDIVLTTDRGGRLTSINQKGRTTLGLEAGATPAVTLSNIVAPASIEDVASWIERVESPGAPLLAARSVTLRATDGHLIPAEGTIQAIRQDGVVVGLQAIIRDVSEREAMAARMRESQKLEAVGSLAAGIAHDFNNVLSVIMCTAALLREDLPRGNAAGAGLDTIHSAVTRAADLVRQLLAFARQQVLVPEELNLNDTVSEAESMLRRVIREDIELVTHLTRDPWITRVDPGQLTQVVMNLALNARDAMPDGGTLTIMTRNQRVQAGDSIPEGEYASLIVRDTGIGMNAETQAHAFEPFFSTKAAGSGSGSGLGLATVYGIVTQSGGHIELNSAPGKGTQFSIYFPRVAGTQAVSTRTASASLVRAPRAASETLLVVEDEPALRTLLCRALERTGYRVFSAENGEAALQVARTRGDVSLVVTDMVMPVMGGMQLYERLRVEHPDMRVIFMSGYSRESEELLIARRGARMLAKPMSVEQLQTAVREALDS